MNGFRENQTSALSCAHTTTRVQREPENSQHYAKLLCANCGVQLRILPRPESIEQRRKNAIKLGLVRRITGLNTWERQFIDSLDESGKTKLSPAQQQAFDEICNTYLHLGVQQLSSTRMTDALMKAAQQVHEEEAK
jgi:hypothetical protein